MFIESLESRTLLSNGTTVLGADGPPTRYDTAVALQVAAHSTLLIPGPARDLVFDNSRNQLLKIEPDRIDRYDPSNGHLLDSIVLGKSLTAADITPDGKFLYVTDDTSKDVYKIDLDTTDHILIHVTDYLEMGAPADIAIAGGKAVVSQRAGGFSGFGDFMVQIDLATDQVSRLQYQYGNLTLWNYGLLGRSADYSTAAIVSTSDEYLFDGNLAQGHDLVKFGDVMSVAVSRNGDLHSVSTAAGSRVLNRQFHFVRGYGSYTAMAFDPQRDLLYVADPFIDRIDAMDTHTWNGVFSMPVGEDLVNGPNKTTVAPDGTLFLTTPSGVRVYHTSSSEGTYKFPTTFTANVSSTFDGQAPSGTVSFTDALSGQDLGQAQLQNGVAKLTLDTLRPGSYSVFARYAGDDVFSTADSAAAELTIDPAPTSVKIRGKTADSLQLDLDSIAGAPAGGTITLLEGDNVVSTTDVGSSTMILPIPLSPGFYNLTARYSGFDYFAPASSTPLSWIVHQPTTITLEATPQIVTHGEFIRATATIDSGAFSASGGCEFYINGVFAGVYPVEDGKCLNTIANYDAGEFNLTVKFLGTNFFLPSTSNAVSLTINKAAVSMDMSPITTFNVHYGDLVHFHVNITTALEGEPSGYLDLKEGDNVIWTANVYRGVADFDWPAVLGSHSLMAIYRGDVNFVGSATGPIPIAVAPANASVKLKLSDEWAIKGRPVTLAATVSTSSVLAPLSEGQVTFKDKKRILGTVPVTNGQAMLETTDLAAGTRSITATLSGANLQSSASKPASITVVSGSTVDLMIVYTPKARNSAGGQDEINSLITDAVANSNTALLNSRIPLVLNLVYSSQVDYKESGKLHTDIDRLTRPRDGWMDGVQALRNNYGADLVSLFVSDGDLGGAGWELRDLHDKTNPNFAFSVVLASQAAAPYYALAHELGHNLGATHDAEHREGKGATSFSNGWRFRGKDGKLYHDIMSYDPGKTIPYFSNPRIKFQGVPTGNPRTADAARTITLTAPYVAAYRRPGRVLS